MAQDYKNKNTDLIDDELSVSSNYLSGEYLPANVRTIYKKKSAWLFLLLSLAILFVVGWYLKSQILEAPFAYNLPGYLQDQFTDSKSQEEIVADLKNKDTDQDGLNDYQEIYQFHTSIFLADSDSDGFSDFDEANSGNDPLCPSGEDCNLLRLITPNTKLAEVVEGIVLDPSLTLEQATLNQFRSFLVDNGLSQEEVDALTDDDLLIILTAYAEDNQANEEVNFADLNPEEIRQFLLNQPNADQQVINSLSEQELIDIRDRLITQ